MKSVCRSYFWKRTHLIIKLKGVLEEILRETQSVLLLKDLG